MYKYKVYQYYITLIVQFASNVVLPCNCIMFWANVQCRKLFAVLATEFVPTLYINHLLKLHGVVVC